MATHPLPCAHDDAESLVLFEALLCTLASSGSTQFYSEGAGRALIVQLGLNPSVHGIRLLASLRIHHVCPLHLDVVRTLAKEVDHRDRVRDVILDEFLIELLGFERVQERLTRRFFTTWQCPCAEEEPLWWAAINIELALERGLLEAVYISSRRELLRCADLARQALGRGSIGPDPETGTR